MFPKIDRWPLKAVAEGSIMPDEMREEDKLPGVAPEVAGPPAGLGESLPPPAPSPWGSRDLGLFVALFVFAAIVFPVLAVAVYAALRPFMGDRKSTRLNSSHLVISYAVFCLKKKKKARDDRIIPRSR